MDSLDKKYLPDVVLVEGEYESLLALQKRIGELNALYDFPGKGSIAERAYQLVKEYTGVDDLVCNCLSFNFKEGWGDLHGKVSEKRVYEILDKEGLKYLKHNIVARPDGVYDDRTAHGTLSDVDETKIADVSLKLIE